MKPPAPEALRVPDRHYERALREAMSIEPQQSWTPDDGYQTYCWMFWPSRITWPIKHVDRPTPTPGCGCRDCHRPRCCGTWAEPVEVFTGELVAWICPTCLEPVTA